MPEDRLCPHCAAWLCRGDDAWCGYCGHACAQLELQVMPSVLHLGHRPSPIFCKLINYSCATLSVSKVKHPAWLSFESQPSGKLGPGGSLVFFATAKSEAMEEPESVELIVSTAAGDASTLLMVIEEKPVLICEPGGIQVWSDGQQRQNRTRLAIRPNAGQLRIHDARLRGLPGQLDTENLQSGSLISPETFANVDIEIDAAELPFGDFSAAVTLQYDSPHGISTIDLPFNVQVLQPPQLLWIGEHERPEVRYQTDWQQLGLTFHNQNPDGQDGGALNADLLIHSIELLPPEGAQIDIQQLTVLPVNIPGGEARTANLVLNLTSEQGHPARHLVFDLKVRTNLPTLEKTVTVWVEPMPRFDGIVAIDFGSSNTCCAFVQPGGQPELLPVDTEGLVSPTVVRYVDMTTTAPTIETGAIVKRRALVNQEFAASVADGLKQRLRKVRQEIDIRPFNPNRWITRKASDAAADYLKHIRHVAENRKSAVFQNFILTHPARCPLRQHRRLRKALFNAFGSTQERISYLSEPIAALIPFIVQKAQDPDRNSYTIASFDVGGGTTDVAVVRIDYESPAQGIIEIEPFILHCTGANFGGEDLTDYLVSELEQSCQQLLTKKEAGSTLITANVTAAAALDIRLNRANLRDAAEQFKASVSGSGAPPSQILLRIKEEDGKTSNFPFSFDEVSKLGGRDLTSRFLECTKMLVQEVAGLLTEAVSNPPIELNIIHLSGKTALLKVVREAIQEKFSNVDIVTAPDPKECVVKGACLSRSMQLGRLRLKLPDTTQRMTSTIGLFTIQSPYFAPVLAADTVIPSKGLESDVPEFWAGKESVVLWENLGTEHREIDLPSAMKWLEKLGTWEPERSIELAENELWTLRLTMKEFDLSVAAVSASGEVIPFFPMHGNGD